MNEDRKIDSPENVKMRIDYDYEDSFYSYLRDLRNMASTDPEDNDGLIYDIAEASFSLQQSLAQFAPVINEILQYSEEIIRNESVIDDYFFGSSVLALNCSEPITEFFPQWRKELRQAFLALNKAFNGTESGGKKAREKMVKIAGRLKMPAVVLENLYRLVLNYLFMWSNSPINYEVNLTKDGVFPEYSAEQLKFLEDKFLLRKGEICEKVKQIYYAREKLITYKHAFLETQLRLVITLAKKFKNSGLAFNDVVQEGNLGLMKAIDKFDALLGHKFSTYAVWWIKHNIIRGVAAQSRIIRIPNHMFNLISRINRAEQKLLQDLGREPESSEIADMLELSVAKVNAVRRMARQAISLQSPMTHGDEESGKFEEILEDENKFIPGEEEDIERNYAKLYELLKLLTEREQQIIILRFGLFGNKATPLREISEKFGLTRERIRQLEMKIIGKLRSPKAMKYLSDYNKF